MARSPVPPGQAGPPRLLDQLMLLPPWLRIAAGAVMVALGAVAVALHVSPYSLVLVGLAVALGLPILLHGVADRRRRRTEFAELERARAELPGLRVLVASAVASRHNVRRALRQRGFTTEKAMRWVALECGVVLSRGEGDHGA
jgi:Flp pilus assembly protein TadB